MKKSLRSKSAARNSKTRSLPRRGKLGKKTGTGKPGTLINRAIKPMAFRVKNNTLTNYANEIKIDEAR